MESSASSGSSKNEPQIPTPPPREDRIVILDEQGRDITAKVYKPHDIFED